LWFVMQTYRVNFLSGTFSLITNLFATPFHK
jgi:hypothetical protein